ncbi:MAG: hypothetical protein WC649_09500 [Desulfobacteria bacterium]
MDNNCKSSVPGVWDIGDGGILKKMKEEDFIKEIELIEKDVSDFRIRYSACQYFHERAKYFSKTQLDKAVKLFHQIMEDKFEDKAR